MGGMLCLCYGGMASEIRSATALAARLDFAQTTSDFARLRPDTHAVLADVQISS
jgi:hypothetical protein